MHKLKIALGICSSEPVRWVEVLSEFLSYDDKPITPEIEELLLETLKFRGELNIVIGPAENLPHSMCPTEMLQSLAMQLLGQRTGSKYFTEMRELAEVSSSGIKNIFEYVNRVN